MWFRSSFYIGGTKKYINNLVWLSVWHEIAPKRSEFFIFLIVFGLSSIFHVVLAIFYMVKNYEKSSNLIKVERGLSEMAKNQPNMGKLYIFINHRSKIYIFCNIWNFKTFILMWNEHLKIASILSLHLSRTLHWWFSLQKQITWI